MKGLLVGVGSFLLLRNSSPEEIAPKYHHLRPRRLRRSTDTHNAACSGQHSLAGVGLHGAVCLPMSTPLIGADAHLREGTLLPEEITQNNHYLRPQRLRRSSATHHASSSGQHSLAGGRCSRRKAYLRQGHSSSEVGPRKKTSAAATGLFRVQFFRYLSSMMK